MKEKIVIIGAGIAGLSLANKLLSKGYQVTLVEKNNEVGGLCSGYFVNGHYIDACIHWLMGTNKNSDLYKYWSEVGAFNSELKFISLPTLGSYEYQNTTITFYRDIEKTRKELLDLSPKDEKNINLFIDSVKQMAVVMGLVQGYKDRDYKKSLRKIKKYPHIIKSMRYSKEEYASRFTHPAIRFALQNCQTGYNNMFFFLDLYGLFIKDNADVPSGGAYYMVQRMKDKFLSLSGELLLNTQALELVVNKRKISILKTDKGDIVGDRFVSCLDANYTLSHLSNNKYKVRRFIKAEKNIENEPISSCYNLYITVKGDMSDIDVPTGLNIHPIKVGDHFTDFLLVRPYHFDSCFIKDNKTVVSLFIDQNHHDYQYFKSLNEEEYQKEINNINLSLINAFIERYPQFKDKVEILDYFSPVELEKRTNSKYGAIQAYSFTNKSMFHIYNGKVRGLKNFYLCSQWNRSIGGTPTALLTAISVSKKFK